jgi:hypothetical protein
MDTESAHRLRTLLASAGLLAALATLATNAGGQTTGRRQGGATIAGCPEDPVAFHRCAVQKEKLFKPARTPDGHPDMQGVWDGTTGGARTLTIEARQKSQWYQAAPTVIVDPPDGKIPYQEWAAAKKAANVDAEKDYVYVGAVDPHAHCLLQGVPRQIYDQNGFQIVQSAGFVGIFNEFIHAYRIIPTSGHAHLNDRIRLWMGDSRGHWEGDTLVVDVTNSNGKPWFDIAGDFQSDALHVTERFTLVDANTIHYEATINDLKVFTRPWTLALPVVRFPQKDYEMLEHACHEGEQDTPHLADSADPKSPN